MRRKNRPEQPITPIPENNNHEERGRMLEFKPYLRKPFMVQAVEVTRDNIAEVAEHVGRLSQEEDGTPVIIVDREKVQGGFRVYPGFFMTKMEEHDFIRCYSRKAFHEQFMASDTASEVSRIIKTGL